MRSVHLEARYLCKWEPKVKLSILSVIVVCSIAGICNAQESDEREADAISIGQAFAANWEQLDSYDLLMTLEQFEVTPTGGTEEQFDTYRLISDHVNGRFCFVQKARQISAQNADSKAITKRRLRGFYYDEQSRVPWYRDTTGKPYQMSRRDKQYALGRSNFPDIRMIGFLRTSSNFSTKQDIREWYQISFHPGKTIWEQKRTGTTSELILEIPIGNHGVVTRRTLLFDTTRYVPIKVSQAFADSEITIKRETERIEWKMISGVYVPESVHGERTRHYGSSKSKDKARTTVVYDAKFHWLSVNQPVLQEDDEVARPQILLDTKNLLQLVAPDLPDDPS